MPPVAVTASVCTVVRAGLVVGCCRILASVSTDASVPATRPVASISKFGSDSKALSRVKVIV